MSQILIELLRDAPFLRGGTIFRGADMDDPNLNTQKLQTEPFLGKVIGVRTEVPHFSGEHGRWMWNEDYLPVKEFEQIVRKCAVLGPNSKVITPDDINIYNVDDDFFTDEKFRVVLIGGKTVLDDSNPVHRLVAAMFLVDSRFVRVEGDRMPNYADEIYSIGFAEQVEKARIEDSKINIDVAAILKTMERESLVTLSKIWDKNPSNKISDDTIQGELFDLILRDPNNKRVKSRGQFFLRFAKFSKAKLKTFNHFLNGRKARLITRNDEDLFVFSGVELGRDEEESVDFLMEQANDKMLSQLVNAIKLKSPTALKHEHLAMDAPLEEALVKPEIKGGGDGNKSSDPQ